MDAYKNIEDVLGIRVSEKTDDMVLKILNIPVIKSELGNWDMVSEYVGQMVEYDNPKYNHQMWIKIKIFPFKDKEEPSNDLMEELNKLLKEAK